MKIIIDFVNRGVYKKNSKWPILIPTNQFRNWSLQKFGLSFFFVNFSFDYKLQKSSKHQNWKCWSRKVYKTQTLIFQLNTFPCRYISVNCETRRCWNIVLGVNKLSLLKVCKCLVMIFENRLKLLFIFGIFVWKRIKNAFHKINYNFIRKHFSRLVEVVILEKNVNKI